MSLEERSLQLRSLRQVKNVLVVLSFQPDLPTAASFLHQDFEFYLQNDLKDLGAANG